MTALTLLLLLSCTGPRPRPPAASPAAGDGAASVQSSAAGALPARRDLPAPADAKTLRVATFNVHYLAPGTQEPLMRWEGRDDSVVSVIRSIDPDLVAFQEMETFIGSSYNPENLQQQTLEAAFPGYGFAATGEPSSFPNTQPVMYRRERLAAREQGFFFFGPQPDVLYSEPWLGRYSAYATWVRMHDRRTGGVFLVVNLHIDRTNYRNQLRSADLTVERISRIRQAEDQLIVMGDFNAFAVTGPLRRIRRGLRVARVPGNGATYHFNRGVNILPAIDHILYDPRLTPQGSWTVRSRPGETWPSDHYPVVGDLLSH